MRKYVAVSCGVMCSGAAWTDLEYSAAQQLLLWRECSTGVLHVGAKLTQKLQQAKSNFWRYQLPAMLTKALMERTQTNIFNGVVSSSTEVAVKQFRALCGALGAGVMFPGAASACTAIHFDHAFVSWSSRGACWDIVFW